VRTNNDGGSNPAFAGRVPMSSVQAAAEADAVEEDDDAPRPAAKQKQRKQSKQAPKKNSKQQETQSPSANQTTSLNSVAPFRPANGRFDSYAQ